MMNTLSIFERITLESLENKKRDIQSLSNDTGIQTAVLKKVLLELKSKNMICLEKELYYINKDAIDTWLGQISGFKSVKNELKNIFELVVSNYKDVTSQQSNNQLKLQKIYMTRDEERIFETYTSQFENFIKEIHRNRKVDRLDIKTKAKKVVYWGSVEYSSLINEALA